MKQINDDDFVPLVVEEALGQVRMIPHRWKLLIDTLQASVSFEDPDFPVDFFITELLQQKLSPKLMVDVQMNLASTLLHPQMLLLRGMRE